MLYTPALLSSSGILFVSWFFFLSECFELGFFPICSKSGLALKYNFPSVRGCVSLLLWVN